MSRSVLEWTFCSVSSERENSKGRRHVVLFLSLGRVRWRTDTERAQAQQANTFKLAGWLAGELAGWPCHFVVSVLCRWDGMGCDVHGHARLATGNWQLAAGSCGLCVGWILRMTQSTLCFFRHLHSLLLGSTRQPHTVYYNTHTLDSLF